MARALWVLYLGGIVFVLISFISGMAESWFTHFDAMSGLGQVGVFLFALSAIVLALPPTFLIVAIESWRMTPEGRAALRR